MPLWKVYHGTEAFTKPADKFAVAKAITDLYTNRGLPDFYVNILFIPFPTENLFNAAKPRSGHVMVEILHVARNMDPNDHELHTKFKNAVDRILGPYTLDRGLHLEYAVVDCPQYLARINGVDIPESFGPEQKDEADKARARLQAMHTSLS